MGKWKVIHKIYDNGTSENLMCEAEQDEISSYKNEENYDLYVDVFDDHSEAARFLDELLKEEKPNAE